MARREGKIDIAEVEAALKRAARTALHGSRDERSGRFRSGEPSKTGTTNQPSHPPKDHGSKRSGTRS